MCNQFFIKNSGHQCEDSIFWRNEVMELAMEHDKGELTKESKKDIENKIVQILKLLRNNSSDKKGKLPPSDDPKKRSELVSLVEDVHKQYQSLYSKYANLRGVTAKKARVGKKKSGSASNSASDSEHYSPMEVEREKKFSTMTTDMSETQQGSDDEERVNHEVPTTLMKVDQDSNGSRGVAQVKELEGQLIANKFEMEFLRKEKREMESLLERKVSEVNELQSQITEIKSRYSAREEEEKEDSNDDVASISKRMKDSEEKYTSRIEELATEVNSLQTEVASLHNMKQDLELKLEEKATEVTQCGERNIQLNSRILELEHILETKVDEKDSILKEMRDNGEDMRSRIENLIEKVATLETEVEYATSKKKDIEAQMQVEVEEAKELKDINEELHVRILDLESTLKGTSMLVRTLKDNESKLTERITELTAQVAQMSDRTSELEQLLSDREGQVSQEASMEITNLKEQVTRLQQELDSSSNVSSEKQYQTMTLKERDNQDIGGSSKLETTLKPVRHLSMESPKVKSVENNKTLERKMEELAEQYQMRMENHIRLLRQRVKVAEQIHNETKDSYKQIKDELEQENKELHDKVVAFEDALKRMKATLIEPGGTLLTGLDVLIRKLDENKHPLNRMSKVSDELQNARNWMAGKKGEIKHLKENVDDLTMQLSDKEGKVLELEARLTMALTLASEEEEEIDGLMRKVQRLEQELRSKEEVIVGFGEEKKEAIRQLCMLIDYHRDRYDHLRRTISLMKVKQNASTPIA
ncbi:COP1-interactive protein 1 [Linum grandiflorum]